MMDFILGFSIGDYIILIVCVLFIFSVFIYDYDDNANERVIDIMHLCLIALFIIGMALYIFGVPLFF